MNIGAGIAVAGIWIGVGMSAIGCGGCVIIVGFFAMLATMFATAGTWRGE